MRISDWSSDVCASDLRSDPGPLPRRNCRISADDGHDRSRPLCACGDLSQKDHGLDAVVAYGYTCACFNDHNPGRVMDSARRLTRNKSLDNYANAYLQDRKSTRLNSSH